MFFLATTLFTGTGFRIHDFAVVMPDLWSHFNGLVREQACACDGPVGEKSRYTRGMFCPPKLVQALENVSADVCLGNNVFACVGSVLCCLSPVVTVSSFVSESRI